MRNSTVKSEISPLKSTEKTLLDRMEELLARERHTQYPGYFDHIQEFMKEAEQEEDEAAKTLCHSLLAEYYYDYYNEKLFRKHLLEASKSSEEVREKVPLSTAITYNLMGIDEFNKGNLELSLEYYMNVIDVSAEDDRSRYIAMNNMAIIYGKVENLERKLELVKQAYAYFSANDFLSNRVARLNSLCQYVECEFHKKNSERIKELLSEMLELAKNSPDFVRESPLIESSRIYYCLLSEDMDGADALMPAFFSKLRAYYNIMDLTQDITNLGYTLLKYGKTDCVKDLISVVTERLLNEGTPTVALGILEFCIAYYEQIGDTEAAKNHMLKYYKVSMLRNESDRISMRRNIDFHESLVQITLQRNKAMRENLRLQTESNTDALTQLPNRRLLNLVADKSFETAYNNQTLMGVDILDLDFFKQINDTYGHRYGDECLTAIAGVLKNLAESDERIFASRYGGDEFCVIYNNMTDEEIIDAAVRLKRDILALKMPSPASTVSEYLTVSQGIRNSVPQLRNRTWDFMYTADDALYRVKNKKKGEILLVHSHKIGPDEWSSLGD